MAVEKATATLTNRPHQDADLRQERFTWGHQQASYAMQRLQRTLERVRNRCGLLPADEPTGEAAYLIGLLDTGEE